MANRTQMNLSVRPETKEWFRKNRIKASRFMEFAVSEYCSDPQTALLDMWLSKLDELDSQRDLVLSWIEESTDEDPNELMSRREPRIRRREDESIRKLFIEIPDRFIEALEGTGNSSLSQLRSWLEGRLGDYGIAASPGQVIASLQEMAKRPNGHE